MSLTTIMHPRPCSDRLPTSDNLIHGNNSTVMRQFKKSTKIVLILARTIFSAMKWEKCKDNNNMILGLIKHLTTMMMSLLASICCLLYTRIHEVCCRKEAFLMISSISTLHNFLFVQLFMFVLFTAFATKLFLNIIRSLVNTVLYQTFHFYR